MMNQRKRPMQQVPRTKTGIDKSPHERIDREVWELIGTTASGAVLRRKMKRREVDWSDDAQRFTETP